MKIFVGMSGGVDSSVAALLLKRAGNDITGVFIKTWQPDYIECTWKEDRMDAMRVCSQLDIPFVTLDAEREYKEGVIDYMLSEYEKGDVPNPDVMCNREVKFGAFLKFAMDSGADAIATGHYADIEKDNDEYFLKMSKDKNKDQSYFLYQIKKNDLNKVIFPISNIEKTEVRKIAKENNLYVADKKDSQGLCMLGDISIKDFLREELKYSDRLKEGDVKDENGKVIGTHNGVILYTIGERHHLNIKSSEENTKPYFIIKKDIENNILVVSHESPKLSQDKKDFVLLNNINIFEIPKVGVTYSARSRYRGELKKVKLDIDGDNIKVSLLEDLLCVPGQSLVVYDDSGRVVCGGIIN